ncbi:unnamed protein product [Toxocara canis]|uniref:Tropomyosin alpha-1 chain n=1 Tax=Toxocara canis TaxID=6265 RepID=A0A183VE38_TOXCA|nr:unnamed protein product [Toxocara canis]
MGAKWREEIQRRAAVAQKGYAKRLELANEGSKIKAEKEKSIDGLRKERNELLPKRDEAEGKKKEIEEKEREAKDRHHKAWEEERDQKKQVKDYLSGVEESDLEHFKMKVYETIEMLFPDPDDEKKTEKVEGDTEKAEIKDKQSDSATPGENEMSGAEDKGRELEELAELEGEPLDGEHATALPPPPPPPVHSSPSQLHLKDSMPDYDDATKKLMEEADEARKVYNEISDRIRDLDSSISSLDPGLAGLSNVRGVAGHSAFPFCSRSCSSLSCFSAFLFCFVSLPSWRSPERSFLFHRVPLGNCASPSVVVYSSYVACPT